jgi:hypothetical protein
MSKRKKNVLTMSKRKKNEDDAIEKEKKPLTRV